MKSFVILGIGRFGDSIARTLHQLGHEVLVVDGSEEAVTNIADHVTHAVIGDCTDEQLLQSLGLRNFDVGIIAIGDDLETSVLATVLLKDLGVSTIISKAQNDIHAKVLKRVGADMVVLPERDMGVRLAHRLSSGNILEHIELSAEFTIAEIAVPPAWQGKTPRQLDIRKKHSVNILAVKRNNTITVTPGPDYLFEADDLAVVLGTYKAISLLQPKA